MVNSNMLHRKASRILLTLKQYFLRSKKDVKFVLLQIEASFTFQEIPKVKCAVLPFGKRSEAFVAIIEQANSRHFYSNYHHICQNGSILESQL